MLPMATGKRRINSAVRVLLIALAAEPEHARVVAELEHDPVAAELVLQVVAELEHARVVVELEHAPVVAEPELARGAAQLELGQVGAVAVPGHQRARLAVAPRTKSVTAAHRRGLPLRAAEDLAVVAETTREPAATGEVIAWAAAVIAVAAVAEAEAEDADDMQTIDLTKTNENKTTHYEFVETVRDCLRGH